MNLNSYQQLKIIKQKNNNYQNKKKNIFRFQKSNLKVCQNIDYKIMIVEQDVF